MRIGIVRWVRSSLFVKILLIILLSYVVITWTSIETHRAIFKHPRFEKKMENTVNFCNFIIDDIGTPPDTLRAAKLAQDLNIHLRIATDRFTWASPRDMRPLDSDKLSQYRYPNVHIGFDRGI